VPNVFESTSFRALPSSPPSKRRLPLPTMIGKTIRRYSSMRSCSINVLTSCAAEDEDVLAGLPLELINLFGDIPLYDRRVVPPERLLEGSGGHLLGVAVHQSVYAPRASRRGPS
jgi:hypothetical protein